MHKPSPHRRACGARYGSWPVARLHGVRESLVDGINDTSASISKECAVCGRCHGHHDGSLHGRPWQLLQHSARVHERTSSGVTGLALLEVVLLHRSAHIPACSSNIKNLLWKKMNRFIYIRHGLAGIGQLNAATCTPCATGRPHVVLHTPGYRWGRWAQCISYEILIYRTTRTFHRFC